MTHFLDFSRFVTRHYPLFSDGLLHLSPLMVSPFVVPISTSDQEKIRTFVSAIDRLNSHPQYASTVLGDYPTEFRIPSPPLTSPIVGFDFHLTPDGPKLIEVNTNPAASLLVFLLYQFHSLPIATDFLSLLRTKFASKSHWLILDEDPTTQKTYFEFLWFKRLFESWGLTSQISDIPDVEWASLPAHYGVYNRYCDFLLSEPRSTSLKSAYLSGKLTLIPSPHDYIRLSDKARLVHWSRPSFLSQFNLSDADMSCISSVVPPVSLITQETMDEVWDNRKRLFFKPVQGYGSKGAFSGKSISKTAFMRLTHHPTLAQPYFDAPLFSTRYNDQDLSFKYDVRAYVINGEVVMMAGRLFNGQVTNLTSMFGGFSALLCE